MKNFTSSLLKLKAFLFCMFLSSFTFAQVPDFLWAKQALDTESSATHNVALDDNGNIYATGGFQGTVSFDSITFTSIGVGANLYIVKYDSLGNVLWAVHDGTGSGNAYGKDIFVDPLGNIYITGDFHGTATFGSTTLSISNNALAGLFVVKYNAAGTLQWAVHGECTSTIGVTSIARDLSGNLYITGHFSDTATFGSTVLTNYALNVFVVKYNSAGTVQWGVKGGPTFYPANGVDIAIDLSGNIYVTGYFSQGSAIFGTFTLPNSGSADLFVVKYDPSGTVLWAVKGGGALSDRGASIDLDGIGNIYVAGMFEGFALFGSTTLSSNGNDDILVVKYNSSGAVLWANNFGGSLDEWASVIKTDGSGNSYIIGEFWGSINFGSTAFTSSGNRDVLVAKLDSLGNELWAVKAGGLLHDWGQGIAIDINGELYITGWFDGSANFGNFNLSASSGTTSSYIARLSFNKNYKLGLYSKKNDPANYNGTFLDDALTFLENSISANTNTFKICADGSKASLFKFTCDGCDLTQVKFRIKSDPTASDTLLFGYFNDSTAYALNGDTLLVTFRHPSYLGTGFNQTFRNDTLQLINTSTQEVIFENPLEIYRAPVVLVHGLASEEATYKSMTDSLVINNLYPYYTPINFNWESPLIHRADYSYTHMSNFSVNKKVVPAAIDMVLNKAVLSKFSCGNAIVVGHSMGGLLSRLYLQNSYPGINYRNDIQKLITINTPHYGSQVANYAVQELPFNAFNTFCTLLFPGSYGSQNRRGAINDLRVNSYPITQKVNTPQVNKVPSITLSSVGTLDYSTGTFAAIHALLSYALYSSNIYNGDLNDLIVPLKSQQAGIISSFSTPDQWHGCLENPNVIDKVEYFINQSPNSFFTQNGFAVDSVTYHPVVQPPVQRQNLNSSTATIQITSPNTSQIFNPGDSVIVNISSSPAINHIALFVTGPSIQPIVIDTGSVQQLSFSIPATASGILYLDILGGDSTSWLASDTVSIIVQSTLPPDSIISSPTVITQSLGLISTINVSGYFGSSNPVSLLNNPNLIMNYDANFLTHVSGLSFQSLDTGNTFIVFTYLGQSDTSYINIIDNPSALSAGFDYSTEEICAGDSIIFTNQSQGLAVSYQWSFPGGNPAQSSQQHPVVVYPSGGSFSASLKTTFVNGVDSILIDSLIVVNSLPTLAISGNTSFCAGDSTILDAGSGFSTYLWSTNSTSQSITTSMSGLYVVTVTDMNSCSNSTNVTVNINSVDTTVTANGFTLMANAGSASYQWINCADSVFIPGQAGQTFVATQDGNYAVIVSQNGCSDTSNCYTILGTGISIVDHTENISIYPNPTNALLYIHMDGIATSKVNITLTNPLGQIVIQRDLNTHNQAVETEFDLKNLPGGIYFLSVNSNKTSQTFKVQKL